MDALMDGLLETARQSLARDGYLVPVLIVVDGAGALAVIGLADMAPTSEGRQEQLYALGTAMAQTRPARILMIADSYRRVVEKEKVGEDETVELSEEGGLRLRKSLADDPKATEAVMLSSLTADGVLSFAVLPYERFPQLEGTEFRFDEVQEGEQGAGAGSALISAPLLQVFFEGVAKGAK